MPSLKGHTKETKGHLLVQTLFLTSSSSLRQRLLGVPLLLKPFKVPQIVRYHSKCFEFDVGFLMELRKFSYNFGESSFILWQKISDNIDIEDSRFSCCCCCFGRVLRA